jgi:hypothetical protein
MNTTLRPVASDFNMRDQWDVNHIDDIKDKCTYLLNCQAEPTS